VITGTACRPLNANFMFCLSLCVISNRNILGSWSLDYLVSHSRSLDQLQRFFSVTCWCDRWTVTVELEGMLKEAVVTCAILVEWQQNSAFRGLVFKQVRANSWIAKLPCFKCKGYWRRMLWSCGLFNTAVSTLDRTECDGRTINE
jgi:hypothetical protein